MVSFYGRIVVQIANLFLFFLCTCVSVCFVVRVTALNRSRSLFCGISHLERRSAC